MKINRINDLRRRWGNYFRHQEMTRPLALQAIHEAARVGAEEGYEFSHLVLGGAAESGFVPLMVRTGRDCSHCPEVGPMLRHMANALLAPHCDATRRSLATKKYTYNEKCDCFSQTPQA